MSDGGVSGHRRTVDTGGRFAVQVFNRRKRRGYQHYRDLLYFFLIGGTFLLEGGRKPPVSLGDVSGDGVFCDYLCGVRRGRSRFCAGQ